MIRKSIKAGLGQTIKEKRFNDHSQPLMSVNNVQIIIIKSAMDFPIQFLVYVSPQRESEIEREKKETIRFRTDSMYNKMLVMF